MQLSRLIFVLGFSLCCTCLHSQSQKVIQFSGVVLSRDSLKSVPFVNVTVRNTSRGTVTDFWGFFSFAIQKNDTIEFSCVGFKKTRMIIPDTIKRLQYYTVIPLTPDTIYLKTVEIKPWPPLEQFKQVFLQKKVPDDLLERAKKNLNREDMKMAFKHAPMGASMNFNNVMQQSYDRTYYNGQYPPMRLLDPIAWSKFIKAWQNGELKIQKD